MEISHTLYDKYFISNLRLSSYQFVLFITLAGCSLIGAFCSQNRITAETDAVDLYVMHACVLYMEIVSFHKRDLNYTLKKLLYEFLHASCWKIGSRFLRNIFS